VLSRNTREIWKTIRAEGSILSRKPCSATSNWGTTKSSTKHRTATAAATKKSGYATAEKIRLRSRSIRCRSTAIP
jgi:hypothetical protein